MPGSTLERKETSPKYTDLEPLPITAENFGAVRDLLRAMNISVGAEWNFPRGPLRNALAIIAPERKGRESLPFSIVLENWCNRNQELTTWRLIPIDDFGQRPTNLTALDLLEGCPGAGEEGNIIHFHSNRDMEVILMPSAWNIRGKELFFDGKSYQVVGVHLESCFRNEVSLLGRHTPQEITNMEVYAHAA